MKWGYHHLRKHPYIVDVRQVLNSSFVMRIQALFLQIKRQDNDRCGTPKHLFRNVFCRGPTPHTVFKNYRLEPIRISMHHVSLVGFVDSTQNDFSVMFRWFFEGIRSYKDWSLLKKFPPFKVGTQVGIFDLKGSESKVSPFGFLGGFEAQLFGFNGIPLWKGFLCKATPNRINRPYKASTY